MTDSSPEKDIFMEETISSTVDNQKNQNDNEHNEGAHHAKQRGKISQATSSAGQKEKNPSAGASAQPKVKKPDQKASSAGTDAQTKVEKPEDKEPTSAGAQSKVKQPRDKQTSHPQAKPTTKKAENKQPPPAQTEVKKPEDKGASSSSAKVKITDKGSSVADKGSSVAAQADVKKTKPYIPDIPDMPDDVSSEISSAPSLLDSTEELDTAQRDRLYEQATQYQRRTKIEVALKCYLRCLRGLLDPSGFTYLPQCLHRIADIYYERENFESAIQFIQAEKMYYETALVDTSDIQQKIESKQREMEQEGSEETDANIDINAGRTDILRAHEYEELARLCLNRKQPNLALEYQAKATKLRQDIYGENHDVTMASLDFFTIVYAEVGKQQYSESMLKLGSEPLPTMTYADTKPNNDAKRKTEEVQSENRTEQQRSLTPEDEEWVSQRLLLVLFFICSVLLAIIGSYLYCRFYEGTSTCAAWKSDIHYYYMRMKYFYYHYTGLQQKKYG